MFSSYEFNYSWSITHGHLVPLAVAAVIGGLAWWLGWSKWIVAACSVVALWAAAGLYITLVILGINQPLSPPAARFLASGTGHVLDAGAGSGRATVGLLLARPQATVTALDLYDGYWGIDDNTPERLMTNARLAGAASRADAIRGDMRALPFQAGEFDGVMSVAAIDHLRRAEIPKALAEFSRVLKPRGEVLLVIVNPDWITKIASPHAIAHHRAWDPNEWRTMLDTAGFSLQEDGTGYGYLYFHAVKKS
jgi:ubiquinone/menaquinone biosynthesis C-methylase UbiE